MPEEFLELLKVEAFRNVGDYAFQITKRAKNIILSGLKDGLSAVEIMDLIEGELEDTTETWASTVLRTKTTEIFNEARKKYWEFDEDAKQIVVGYQWSAILDDRTSDICNHLDGKIMTIEESQWLKPPAHFNCRSLLIPMTTFEDFKYSPKKDIGKDSLDKIGGSGLLFTNNQSRKNYQIDIENKSNLINSSMINLFNDTVIIAQPGVGKHLAIISCFVSNSDLEQPVTVGFRGQNENELKYKALLNSGGGQFHKEFNEQNWILNDNESFIINLSAPINVEYTIEYIITDANGNRVM
jgi:SPP1 gp7 family putative phage head morphogenesis protein